MGDQNQNLEVVIAKKVIFLKLKILVFISNQPKDKTNSEIFNEYRLRTEPISIMRTWKRTLLKLPNWHLLTNPGSKVVLKTTVILKVLKSAACKKTIYIPTNQFKIVLLFSILIKKN